MSLGSSLCTARATTRRRRRSAPRATPVKTLWIPTWDGLRPTCAWRQPPTTTSSETGVMPRLRPYLVIAVLAGCGGDDKCDPIAQTGCDDGNVCETVAGGE